MSIDRLREKKYDLVDRELKLSLHCFGSGYVLTYFPH